jgi:hypothetical protein
LRLVPLLVVALALLSLLLLAGAAFVAAWTYVGLWAGLAAAAVVVDGGAEGLALRHKPNADHDQPDCKGG